VLALAKADLEYYDKIIDISRARFKPATWPRSTWPGSSFSACNTSLKSRPQSSICAPQKIQLLLLLDDRTPVDQFDVTGSST
jgi:outer membrane protein, heavy metal efflux system